eukprot:14986612-Alexandrium_andersonii.AAC.1
MAGLNRRDGSVADVAYDAVWLGCYEHQARGWFAQKSRDRRWWPTDGTEWRILEHAQSFTAASHVARVLGGGLHGPAGPRTTAQRALRPRRCCCCAAEQ